MKPGDSALETQQTAPTGIPSEEQVGTPNVWQERFDAFLERVRKGSVAPCEIDAELAAYRHAPKGSLSGFGKFAGRGSSSEEHAQHKQEEIALEEEREGRRR